MTDDEEPPLHQWRIDNPDATCPRAGNKAVRQILSQCWMQACAVQPTKKGHYRVWPGDSTVVVIVPGTPSDHRSLRNCASQLRRAGLKIKL